MTDNQENKSTKRSSTESVLDTLAQDARVLRRARMLPETGLLSREQIDLVREDFARLRREHRLSQERVGKTLGSGCSARQLKLFELDQLDLKAASQVARRVNQFAEQFERQQEARAQVPREFVETQVAKRIITLVRNTIDMQSIGLIYGPSGVGKTMTLEVAATQVVGSIFLRILQSTRSGQGLFRTLGRKLNLPTSITYTEIQRRVIERLEGTSRPIFIDEAQKLTPEGLEGLRDLHDAAGVPLILSGTIDLNNNCTDTEFFFGQMNSRIALRYDIAEESAKAKRPRPLFTKAEIRKVFADSQLRLTDDAIDLLRDMACVLGLGSLRVCRQVVSVANKHRKCQDAGVIDAETIRVICRSMHSDAHMQLMDRKADSMPFKVAVGVAAG